MKRGSLRSRTLGWLLVVLGLGVMVLERPSSSEHATDPVDPTLLALDPGELHARFVRALDAGQAPESATLLAAMRSRFGDDQGLTGYESFRAAWVASMRARNAVGPTALPGVTRKAFEPALEAYERAVGTWWLAATARQDWPEARRNAERLELELIELIARQQEAAEDPQSPPPPPPPTPDEDEGEEEEESSEEEEAPPETAEARLLAPAEVRRLFERLEKKDQTKRALRFEAQRRRTTGESDW